MTVEQCADLDTRARHQRRASRTERTPRTNNRTPFADYRTLTAALTALGVTVPGRIEPAGEGWEWCGECGCGGGAVSELAAILALYAHTREVAA